MRTRPAHSRFAPYAATRIASVVADGAFDAHASAAAGLGLLFVFTGLGHFVRTEPMMQMLPPWVPARTVVVHATGVLEFAIAAGFFVPRFRRLAGWMAAAVLVLFFPANIYAAVNHVPMGGHEWGPVYLLIRAPLQVVALLWTYLFTIQRPKAATISGIG